MAHQSVDSGESVTSNHVLHDPTPIMLEAIAGPLTGTVCLVEAFNEDGMSASGAYENTLRGLGATVSTQLGEHLTHYIVSHPAAQIINRSNKRILVAEILGITVVSTMWVEQCREAYRLAPTSDFAIKGSLFAATSARKRPLSVGKSSTDDLINNSPRVVEQMPNLGRAIDSPFFNSSQRIINDNHGETANASNISNMAEAVAMASTRVLSSSNSLADLGGERTLSRNTAGSSNSLNRVHTPAPAAPTPIPTSTYTTNTAIITTTVEIVNEVVIPLPTFREYIAPVVPATVLEKVQKRRRSERISDLLEDSDDELNDLANETAETKRARLEYESWECVRNIPIDVSIPIVFLPGQDGDKLPPFVLTKSNNASTTAKGGSGISGLNSKGKKVAAGASHKSHSSVSHSKNGKSVGHSSNGTGGATSKSGGSKVAVKGTSEKSDVKHTWKFDSKGRFAKAEARQPEPAPAETAVVDLLQQPKSKVVIALTGFDDKTGDRSTLLQMLRQLIKTIRKRSADGAVSVSQLPASASSSASAVMSAGVQGSAVATSSAEAMALADAQADGTADVEAGADALADDSTAAETADGAETADACAAAAHSANVSGGNAVAVMDLTGEPADTIESANTDDQTAAAALEASTESADATAAAVLDATAEAPAEAAPETTPGMQAVEVAPVTPSQEKRGRGRPRTVSVGSATSSTTKKPKKPVGKSHKKKVPPVAPAAAVASAASGTSVATSAGSLEGVSPMKRGRGRPRLNSNTSSHSADAVAAARFPEAWYIESLECSVTILSDPNDFSAASCTHVIVNTKSTTRTLRTLFALARGLCILTEEWVYQSVSQEAWAETSQFLHPRYNLYTEVHGYRRAVDVFRGKKILVLDSISPPTEVVVDLVKAAGGQTTAAVDDDGISFVVFGDVSAANEWVSNKLKKKKSSTHKEVSDMRIFAEQRKIVTAKYLFNCIEETKMRPAKATDGEVISLEHLLVFNYTDRNIVEMTQQAFSQAPTKGDLVVEPRSMVPLSPQAAAAEVQRTRSTQKAPPAYKEYVIPAGSVSGAVEVPVAEKSKLSVKAAKITEVAVPEVKASKTKAKAVVPVPPPVPAAPAKAAAKSAVQAVVKEVVVPVEPPAGTRKSLRRAAMEVTDLTEVPDVPAPAPLTMAHSAATASAPTSAVKAGGSKSKQAAVLVSNASPAAGVPSTATTIADEEGADGRYKISYREQRALRRNAADALIATSPPVVAKKLYVAKKTAAAAVPAPLPVPEPEPGSAVVAVDAAAVEMIIVDETSDDANPAMDVTACDLDQTTFAISNANLDDTLDLGGTTMYVDSPLAESGTQHSSRHPSRHSSAAPSPSHKASIDLDKEVDDDHYLETCNRTSNTQAAVCSLLELSTSKPAARSDVANEWNLAAAVAVGAFAGADETLIASLVGSPALSPAASPVRSPAPSPVPSSRTNDEPADERVSVERAGDEQVEQPAAEMTTTSTGADSASDLDRELDHAGAEDDVCEWLEARHAPPSPSPQPPLPVQQGVPAERTTVAAAADGEPVAPMAPVATEQAVDSSARPDGSVHIATQGIAELSVQHKSAASTTNAAVSHASNGAATTVATTAATAAAKAEKKRKSEFVDPYADYDPTKVHATQQQSVLKAQRQVFHHTDAVLLEDDIVDDSSTEGRPAASRGRVGGTAPFRQSFSGAGMVRSAAFAPVGAATTPAAQSHARYSDTVTGSGGKARMRLPSPILAAAASSAPYGNFATYNHTAATSTVHNNMATSVLVASSGTSAVPAPSRGLLTKNGIPVRPAGSNGHGNAGNAGNNNGSDSESDLQFTPATPTVRVIRE